MPRYYTVCTFTPTVKGARGYSSIETLVYSRAPNGFLFHDTEKEIAVSDIRLAARYLAELFDEATSAVVVRINDNTLALTFSLTGIPTPMTGRKAMYPAGIPAYLVPDTRLSAFLKRDLLRDSIGTTYLIKDVNDPASPVIELDLNESYDKCLHLMRQAGDCPCPLARTGECVKEHVLAPSGYDTPVLSDYDVNHGQLRRVRFAEIAGFKYVSSKTTTDDDFGPTFRPWTDHNFRLVEERRTELSSRGIARHVRQQHKEQQCATCAFRKTYVHNPNTYDSCADLRNCSTAVSEADAWLYLYDWLENRSGFLNMPGFTQAEREYLILQAGTNMPTNIFTPGRRTPTLFGGFIRSASEWVYRMVPKGGDLTRTKEYSSAAELIKAIGVFPAKLEPQGIHVNTVLACAILGYHTHIHVHGSGRYIRRATQVTPLGVESVGANTRYERGYQRLRRDDKADNYVFALHGHMYSIVGDYLKNKRPLQVDVPDVSVESLLTKQSS